MIHDKIHQDADAAFFCLRDQLLHVLHRSKRRVDIHVIGNIVSVIHHWGCKHRAEPDDIGSQLFYFVKMTDYAFQISDSISVSILKTLRINLVSNRFVPPLFLHCFSPVHFVFIMRAVL